MVKFLPCWRITKHTSGYIDLGLFDTTISYSNYTQSFVAWIWISKCIIWVGFSIFFPPCIFRCGLWWNPSGYWLCEHHFESLLPSLLPPGDSCIRPAKHGRICGDLHLHHSSMARQHVPWLPAQPHPGRSQITGHLAFIHCLLIYFWVTISWNNISVDKIIPPFNIWCPPFFKYIFFEIFTVSNYCRNWSIADLEKYTSIGDMLF